MWRSCHRKTQRRERRQDKHHDGWRTQTDGDGHSSHRKRLQPVADAQHTARATAIGKSAQKRTDGNTRDELNQNHQHARARPTVTVGEDQQRYPDTKLSGPKQCVGETHSTQYWVFECSPEHRQDCTKPQQHRALLASGIQPAERVYRTTPRPAWRTVPKKSPRRAFPCCEGRRSARWAALSRWQERSRCPASSSPSMFPDDARPVAEACSGGDQPALTTVIPVPGDRDPMRLPPRVGRVGG